MNSKSKFAAGLLAASAIATAAIATSPAIAQTTPMRHSASQTNSLNSEGRQFLLESARGSTLEMATAELALQKAQNPQVVAYATRLINDHARYNIALLQVARQNNVMLPVQVDRHDRSSIHRLERLQGAAFDHQYIQEEAKANAEDLSQMQQALNTASNNDLRNFISEFTPVQQQHLQIATALEGTTTASQGSSMN